MNYSKELINQVVNKYYPLLQITKNISYVGKVKDNQVLWVKIDKEYPKMFKNLIEIIYLKTHSIEEKYCKCGKVKRSHFECSFCGTYKKD